MYRVRAGGSLYTEKLASTLTCSFEEAEVIKRSLTTEHPQFSEALKVHQVAYNRVLKEFEQVIADYESRVGVAIPMVQLIGGGSLFPNFAAYVSQYLNRPAVLASPFNKVAYPAFMEDTMSMIGPSFSVALGAALRTFE
jgi:Tfp pilus assembly PilM family ATPase